MRSPDFQTSDNHMTSEVGVRLAPWFSSLVGGLTGWVVDVAPPGVLVE